MRNIAIVGLAFLAACSTSPLTPEQNAAVAVDAARVQARAARVQAGCDRAMPLVPFALAIPVIGKYVAPGVQVGCLTAEGLAKLAADDQGSVWIGRQEEIMKAGIAKGLAKAKAH